MNKVEVHYIPSGVIGGTRLSTVIDNSSKELREQIYSFIIDFFNSHHSKYDLFLNMMLNPHSDKVKGIEYFNENVRPKIITDIYADSGGLQIARGTKGTNNIKKFKADTYTMQAKWSDYAMCFDKIPIHSNSTSQSDYQNVYFVSDMVGASGIETGRNIKDQIEAFKRSNSKTKIYAILQGTNISQYNEFARGLYSQLDDEDHQFIHGIGVGNLAPQPYPKLLDIYYSLEDLDVPDEHLKNVHFLAFGSFIKMLPFHINNARGLDYFKKIKKVTFDSTTYSTSEQYGKFIDIKNMYKTRTLGMKMNKEVLEMQERRFLYFKDSISKYLNMNINYEEYINNFTVYRKDGQHLIKTFKNLDDFAKYTFRFFLSFGDEVNKYMHGVQNYETHKNTKSRYSGIIELLEKIDSREAFNDIKPFINKTIRKAKMSQLLGVEVVDSLDNVKENVFLDELF